MRSELFSQTHSLIILKKIYRDQPMTSAVFSRTDQSTLSHWWWTVDRSLLFFILVLSAIGVALVATASPPVAERIGLPAFHFLQKHFIFLLPSIGGLLALSFFRERQIWRLSLCGFSLAFIAMIFTHFVGFEVKGAQRWLSIGGFNIQPSEFLKPTVLIISAWLLARAKTSSAENAKKLIIMSLALIGLCLALLLAQPDLGMTVLLSLCFGVQLFIYGFSLRYFVMLGAALSFGLMIVYASFGHVQSRIDRFLDPSSGDSYQIDRSLEAFASGGFIGEGPGQGVVKRQLPDGHADFIFSVAGEEFGFLFTVMIIGVYAFLFYRGIQRLVKQHSLFAMIAGGSLLAMLALQSMIHMGSAMQLIPTKGMTLPLISYGGSSILSVFFTLGVVLALTRKTPDQQIFRP